MIRFGRQQEYLIRPTLTPESVCSSRHVVKLTLKLTQEMTAFAKKKKSDKPAMYTVIRGKRNNPAKGVNW